MEKSNKWDELVIGLKQQLAEAERQRDKFLDEKFVAENSHLIGRCYVRHVESGEKIWNTFIKIIDLRQGCFWCLEIQRTWTGETIAQVYGKNRQSPEWEEWEDISPLSFEEHAKKIMALLSDEVTHALGVTHG